MSRFGNFVVVVVLVTDEGFLGAEVGEAIEFIPEARDDVREEHESDFLLDSWCLIMLESFGWASLVKTSGIFRGLLDGMDEFTGILQMVYEVESNLFSASLSLPLVSFRPFVAEPEEK